MRITKIEAIPYAPPLRNFFGSGVKLGFGELKNIQFGLVKIHTNQNIFGIGEISNVFSPNGGEQCRKVKDILQPILVGEDPRNIARIHNLMNNVLEGMEPAKAGVDIALYDIVGKALGIPVYQLLGGKVRDHINLSYSIMFGEPDEMAELAKELVSDGFGTIKVKVGQGIEKDEAVLKAIRMAVGNKVNIRIDANMSWKTINEALETLKKLEPFSIELAEQPLADYDLEGMAYIRKHSKIPIMADESVWTPNSAMKVIEKKSADIISVYVSEAGGLFRASQIFSMCEAANIPNTIGSMPETGIGTAAQIHLGIAMSNLQYASDCCGSLYYDHDFLKKPLKIIKGRAYPPQGPGLGIELDNNIFKSWCNHINS